MISDRPKKDKADYLHSSVRAALSVIPGIGSLALEIFSAVFEAPIAKRRINWIEELAFGLKNLEGRFEEISIDKLSENPAVISVALKASQTAIRNHQKEKLEMLKNAVLNSALQSAPEEDIQELFLQYIDTITISQFIILQIKNDPNSYYEKLGYKADRNTTSRDILTASLPEWDAKKHLYFLFTEDLHSKGLLSTSELKLGQSTVGRFAAQTTDLGREFIKYISDPTKSNEKSGQTR